MHISSYLQTNVRVLFLFRPSSVYHTLNIPEKIIGELAVEISDNNNIGPHSSLYFHLKLSYSLPDVFLAVESIKRGQVMVYTVF